MNMHALGNAGIYFLVTSVIVIVTMLIFDLLVKFKVWREIEGGNAAVALAAGGIILGTSIILNAAIHANDNLLMVLLWGGIGAVVEVLVYFLFELITPKLNVNEEIARGNKAVGFVCFIYCVASSIIIAACIA
jgi:putative membrane protein